MGAWYKNLISTVPIFLFEFLVFRCVCFPFDFYRWRKFLKRDWLKKKVIIPYFGRWTFFKFNTTWNMMLKEYCSFKAYTDRLWIQRYAKFEDIGVPCYYFFFFCLGRIYPTILLINSYEISKYNYLLPNHRMELYENYPFEIFCNLTKSN